MIPTPEEITTWLNRPNARFGGSTPLEVICLEGSTGADCVAYELQCIELGCANLNSETVDVRLSKHLHPQAQPLAVKREREAARFYRSHEILTMRSWPEEKQALRAVLLLTTLDTLLAAGELAKWMQQGQEGLDGVSPYELIRRREWRVLGDLVDDMLTGALT